MTITVTNGREIPVTIEISQSDDPTRIATHQLEPMDHFDILPLESGKIFDVTPQGPLPFVHEEKKAWVSSETSSMSVEDIENPLAKNWTLYQRGQSINGVNIRFRRKGPVPGAWPSVKDGRATRYQRKEK